MMIQTVAVTVLQEGSDSARSFSLCVPHMALSAGNEALHGSRAIAAGELT